LIISSYILNKLIFRADKIKIINKKNSPASVRKFKLKKTSGIPEYTEQLKISQPKSRLNEIVSALKKFAEFPAKFWTNLENGSKMGACPAGSQKMAIIGYNCP
jgi:hypothetical protein